MEDEKKEELFETPADEAATEPVSEAITEPVSEAVTEPVTEAETENGEYAPYGVSYKEAETEKPPKKEMGEGMKVFLAVIASLLVIAIITGTALHFSDRFSGGNKKSGLWGGAAEVFEPVKYTYVLVHGLGGWGENSEMSKTGNYWGATTGSLAGFLRGKGYDVVVPTVGPYSSTWDRTCELYAQLTGTRVDYGEAHSKAHNHERFGTEYTEPLVPDWSKKAKLNLIGHSFGGETVRMLASLMANGDEAEMKATGKETSELFKGGKADWIFSVTTLASPHNGSQLTEIAGGVGKIFGVDNAVDLMIKVVFSALSSAGADSGDLNLMLEQFGIGGDTYKNAADAIEAVTKADNDHAFYDLSPDGAAKLNKKIKTVAGIYYFSYAYSTVMKTASGKYTAKPGTSTTMLLSANLLGNYKCTTKGGIEIDETWFDNDGLVSVASAAYPAGENHCELDETAAEIQKGIWNTAPVQSGDHGTPVGLGASASKTHDFYTKLFAMIDSLTR